MRRRLYAAVLWLPGKMRSLSFSMRFALLLSAIFSVAALFASALSYSILAEELRARLLEDARLTALSLASDLETGGLEDLVAQFRTRDTLDPNRSTLATFVSTDRTEHGSLRLPEPFEGPRRLVAGRDFVITYDPKENIGETYFAFGLRVPGGWVIAARDSRWIADSQELLMQAVGWGLGVALLATIMVAVSLARRNAIRIEDLNQVLALASDGNLAARFDDTGKIHDDISKVATGLNRMLDRLEGNVERLQQVSADIAHDLRAPLTRLRVQLEPQARRTDLPEDTQQAINRALEGIEGIALTFDAILNLAQLEGSAVKIASNPVDLNGVASSVHEILSPVAEDMGHRLTLDLPAAPVTVSGDKDLLTQALVNLVDNAMRHCPASAEITISVGISDQTAIISVRDNGPGIPETERDKVTRRLYRMDTSRKKSGSGLGLSLVSAIARRHGGNLRLADNMPGLRAELRLPLSVTR